MNSVALGCLASLLGAGCVVHYAPPPIPPPPPSGPPPGAAQPSPPAAAQPAPSALPNQQSQCGPPIRGLKELAHPGAMLLLADLPGTEQVPDFVSDVACQQAESGMSVSIALEIPEQEQSRLDEFLHSGGAEADTARLLEGEFWRRPEQDGRSSRAVLHLIEDVRQMIHHGYRVTAFGYDASRAQGVDRNAAMAENIEAWRERAPDALFLVLASSVRVRGGATETFEPMAARLRRKERWLTLLTLGFDNGTAWTCQGPTPQQIRCGPHPLQGRHPGPFRFSSAGPRPEPNRLVAKWPRPAPDGYQGVYYVGTVTASPPAFDPNRQTSTAQGNHPRPTL